jgi:predicted ABC-type transport system involved in lysophospholipase L1 biosynthesis ATPase subunit
MKPGLLLADEPTGNLDRENSDQVFDLVKQLHLLEGLTSIIVTHDEQLASRCDRTFRLGPAGETSGYV